MSPNVQSERGAKAARGAGPVTHSATFLKTSRVTFIPSTRSSTPSSATSCGPRAAKIA